MATQVQAVKPQSSGSGGILAAIGAVLGAVAAPFTGGASLAATAGLAGAGGSIGSIVGNVADPAKGPEDQGVKTGDAMARRMANQAPAAVTSGDSSAILQESLQAVKSPEVPSAIREQAEPILKSAMSRRMQRGVGVGGIS